MVSESEFKEMQERCDRNRKGKRPPVTVDPANCADTAARRVHLFTEGKRVRQDKAMNKLESEFFRRAQIVYAGNKTLRAQSKRFRLGSGIWYKPDVTVTIDRAEIAYEVKGPHAFRGGFENLKVAAHQYPEITWFLVWKQNGVWKEQRILP